MPLVTNCAFLSLIKSAAYSILTYNSRGDFQPFLVQSIDLKKADLIITLIDLHRGWTGTAASGFHARISSNVIQHAAGQLFGKADVSSALMPSKNGVDVAIRPIEQIGRASCRERV